MLRTNGKTPREQFVKMIHETNDLEKLIYLYSCASQIQKAVHEGVAKHDK